MFINRHQIWILALTSLSTAIIYLENSVLPIAIPSIARYFNLTDLSSMWIVNIYLLTMVVLILVGGRLSDIFGRKRCYLAGLILFGLGSIFASLSVGRFSLFSARMIQGIGGALILPSIGAFLIYSFPEEVRSRAIGIKSSFSSFFLLIGPVVGGFIVTYLGWRAIFWVTLPIIFFVFLIAFFILPADKKRESRFHFLAALPIVATLFCLIFALMQGPFWGWGSWRILSLFALSFFFFLFHFIFPVKAKQAVFDIELLKIKGFNSSTLFIYLAQMATMIYLFLPLFFEDARAFSPLKTGTLMLAETAPYILMAPLGGLLADRYSYRLTITLGFLFMAVGFSLVYFYAMGNLIILMIGLFIMGSGFPWVFSPSYARAMTLVPKEKLGMATGLNSTLRQIAATLSLSIMTALYHSVHLSTGSYQAAFSSLLFMDLILAFVGLFLVQFFLRFPASSR